MKRALVLAVLGACGARSTAASGPSNRPEPAAGPPCTAPTVIGSWRGDLDADWESITFQDDGTFSSYLHDRPFGIGRWSVDGAALVLDGTDRTLRVDGARCADTLTGLDDGQRVMWTRL